MLVMMFSFKNAKIEPVYTTTEPEIDRSRRLQINRKENGLNIN